MEIIILAHNIRSILNLGSIFRTAEGFGVKKVYLSGYTPNWHATLPHVHDKLLKRLHKVALGSENMIESEYAQNIESTILKLKKSGWRIVGLEQDIRAVSLSSYIAKQKIALLIGEEVNGIENQLRKLCDDLIEIPMLGQKESFNVAVATGIALYELSKDSLLAR